MAASGWVARSELDDLAGQLVDAPGHLRVAAEDLGLDLVDVVLQAGDHGQRTRRRPGPGSRTGSPRGPGPAGRGCSPAGGARRTGPGDSLCRTRDHEVRTDEDVQLTELDLLDVVEVAGRAAGRRTGCRRTAPASGAGARRSRPRRPARAGRTRRPARRARRCSGRYSPIQRHRRLEQTQRVEHLAETGRGGQPRAVDVDRAVDHARRRFRLRDARHGRWGPSRWPRWCRRQSWCPALQGSQRAEGSVGHWSLHSESWLPAGTSREPSCWAVPELAPVAGAAHPPGPESHCMSATARAKTATSSGTPGRSATALPLQRLRRRTEPTRRPSTSRSSCCRQGVVRRKR